MKRSAIDWLPTCTNPSTGSSVTKYHSQPTRKYGRRWKARTAAIDTPARISRQQNTHHPATGR